MYLYCKVTPYIITIELLYDEDVQLWYDTYCWNKIYICPNRSKIYDIEDVTLKKYNDIIIEDCIYKIGDLLNSCIRGYEDKEIAYFDDFILNKEYNLFPNGYTGIYKQWWPNGVLQCQILLINGKEYGECITYYDSNSKHIVGTRINGEWVGNVKIYDEEQNLIKEEYY